MKELRNRGPHSEGYIWHIPISGPNLKYYDPNIDEQFATGGRRYLTIRLALGSPYIPFAFSLQVTVQTLSPSAVKPNAVKYRDRFNGR